MVQQNEKITALYFRLSQEDCTPHTVKAMALHQIALGEIQRITEDAK